MPGILQHTGKGSVNMRRKKGYKKPRIHGFEAEGAFAIVKGHVIEEPETIATAIRIGNPASWSYAVEALSNLTAK